MIDIVGRARKALEELSHYDTAPLWEIVPELIAEIERLRAELKATGMTDIDRPTPRAWSFSRKDKITGLLVAEAGYQDANGMLHCYSSRWSGERIYPAQDWKMAMGYAGGGWTW